MKHLITALISIALLCNCKTKNESIAQQSNTKSQEFSKVKFYITTLEKENIAEKKLSIVFDEDNKTASGFSGCNSYIIKYTIDKDIISFEYPGTTKIYCQNTDKLEKRFLSLLTQVKIKEIKNNVIYLKNNNKETLITGIRSQ